MFLVAVDKFTPLGGLHLSDCLVMLLSKPKDSKTQFAVYLVM
jgi:hypothetical protein